MIYSVKTPALLGKMEDLLKKLGMLISDPSSHCEHRIIEFSNYLFAKFRSRMDLIIKLGFDPVLDDVILIFRSCILVLTHPQFNAAILLDKCKALISVLTLISSYDASASNSEPSFIVTLVEVFIKESLTNPDLRRYLHLAEGNLDLIHQLISTHFFLSNPNSQNFIESLSWTVNDTFNDGKETHNELGLDLALELLNSKSSFQIPYLLKAHMAVIGCGYFENRNPVYCPMPDEMVLDRAINAFESSVNLYFQCLCGLNLGGHKMNCKLGTHNKLDSYMDDMILYCHTESDRVSRSDFLWSLFSYIEEAQCIVHERFRQQAGFTLKRLLHGLLSQNNEPSNEFNNNIGAECKISEEMVCLTASLKLMGSSLLQVLDQLREVKNEKQYNRILDIVHRFMDYEANQMGRNVSFDAMGKGVARGEKSLGMLCHLINMLMYGLDGEINFVWKGCVFMIMAVMDLVIFEEGSLDSVKVLVGDIATGGSNHADRITEERNVEKGTPPNVEEEEEEGSSRDSSENVQEGTPKGSMYRESSIRIAREMQKVKKRLFAPCCEYKNSKRGSDGRAFLECLPEYRRNRAQWDDLVDFIDCEPGKDYCAWLNNRNVCRRYMHARKPSRTRINAKKVGRSLRARQFL